MGHFNLEDYAPVDERIGMFYEDCPKGRILTAIERLEPPLVVFKAEVFRDGDDTRPWATGYAYEKEASSPVNKTSYIENCETSAIGRALANAGYHGKREGSPRPSREEMQKVQRMSDLVGEPPQGHVSGQEREKRATRNGSGLGLVPFGKHKGKSWDDLIELDPNYVDWAVKNMDRLDGDLKDALRQALQHREAVVQRLNAGPRFGEGSSVPLSEPEDSLPF